MVASGNATTCLAVLLTVLSCKTPSPRRAAAAATKPDARPPTHCRSLRDRLCTQFGAGSDVCSMATLETASFAPERCAAMLARYEETAASALRHAEGRRALTTRSQPTPHGPAPSLGPESAPLTVVLFSDFTDDNCVRASPVVTAIKNLYADRVRLVFRQFPSSVRAHAHLAAEASLAAQAQGKFWAFHDILFGNPQAHDRVALERYARLAGLDLVRFRAALDRHTFAADVDADVELGRKLSVGSVPAMFVNGNSAAMPYGVEELARIIATASAANP